MSGLEHGQLLSWKGVASYMQGATPSDMHATNRNGEIGEEGDRETEPVKAQKSYGMFKCNKGERCQIESLFLISSKRIAVCAPFVLDRVRDGLFGSWTSESGY